MAQPTETPGEYPVQLTATSVRTLSRWWGIPWLGNVVRFILLIPHFLIMVVLAIGLVVILLVGWIPILVMGRVPLFQARWIEEILRRGSRIGGYGMYLMPGGYPPLGGGRPVPTDVDFVLGDRRINRWWGIPVIGLAVRAVLAIPHFIVLWFLSVVSGLTLIVLWIPILITGHYPEWAMILYSSLLRYQVRVGAYILLLPVPYPPFSLS